MATAGGIFSTCEEARTAQLTPFVDMYTSQMGRLLRQLQAHSDAKFRTGCLVSKEDAVCEQE